MADSRYEFHNIAVNGYKLKEPLVMRKAYT